jgi:pyroglutamyl-peptidase
MRLLLGAFEPFGGETVNPSMAAAGRLARDPPSGVAIDTVVLPVCYARAWPALVQRVEDVSPDLLLLTGLAGGRSGLSVERVAINLDDAPIPDNAGEQRIDTAVVPGAPAAYFVGVPVKAMVGAIRIAGVEASVSHSAGSFLCNHVLYRACHLAATVMPSLRCGFVHLPWLPEQAVDHPGQPGIELEAMVTGLRAAISAAARAS